MKKKTTRKYNCKRKVNITRNRKVNITRKRKNLNLITKKKLKCKKNQLGGGDKKFNRTHALPLLKYCLDLHHTYEEKMNELIKSLKTPSYEMGELKKIHDNFNNEFNYEKTHNDDVNEKNQKEESIKGLAKDYDIEKKRKYKAMFFDFLEKLQKIHDDVFGKSLFNTHYLYTGYFAGGSKNVPYTDFLTNEKKIIDENGYYNLPKNNKNNDLVFKHLYQDILSHEPNQFIKSVDSKMVYYYNGNFKGVSYTESENWFNELIKKFIEDSYFIYMIDERYNYGRQTCNTKYRGNKLSPLYYFYHSIRSYRRNREEDDNTFGVQLDKCLNEIMKKIKVKNSDNLEEIYNVFRTDKSNGQKEMDTSNGQEQMDTTCPPISIEDAQNYNLNKYSQDFKDYIEYFDKKSKKSTTFNDVDLSDFIFNICLYKRFLVNNRTEKFSL